jgi:hypothetical protein
MRLVRRDERVSRHPSPVEWIPAPPKVPPSSCRFSRSVPSIACNFPLFPYPISQSKVAFGLAVYLFIFRLSNFLFLAIHYDTLRHRHRSCASVAVVSILDDPPIVQFRKPFSPKISPRDELSLSLSFIFFFFWNSPFPFHSLRSIRRKTDDVTVILSYRVVASSMTILRAGVLKLPLKQVTRNR